MTDKSKCMVVCSLEAEMDAYNVLFLLSKQAERELVETLTCRFSCLAQKALVQ